MFYITNKESETGKKFNEVYNKLLSVRESQFGFLKKYNFHLFRENSAFSSGGISSCLDFDETPDPKIWKKLKRDDGKDAYFPRKTSKEGKRIAKEIENLPILDNTEFNACIGFDDPFDTIGFFVSEEYFGFSVNDKWNVDIPDDCEEVTTKRFNEIFK